MNLYNIKARKKQMVMLAMLGLPLLSITTSCKDDFLDVAPETSVSQESAFDTPARVMAQVNGLYASIKSGSFLGGRYQIYNDIRAEEFINRLSNGVTGLGVWNHTAGADDTYITNFWNVGYLSINRSNLFLEGLEANASKIVPENLTQYRGEAKFIRALTYFSLVQIFAKPYILDNGASPGLPLRLQGETTSENNSLARSTVAEIYAQILKDLNEAEADLPVSYANATLSTTRANKNTVIALKTRVYLTMGQYQDVITEGNKLVPSTAPFVASTGVQYRLQPSIASVFTNYITSESIFSLPMASTNSPGGQNQLGYYFNGTPNGNREYYLNAASIGIFNNPQFEADDARKTALTATISGQQYLTKFSGVSPFIDWVPIIRYAEVLLNVAEAEAEVGDQNRAIALLQAVHNRSDATWAYTGTTKQDLINAILTERRIELLGEGFRSNDIVRRGMPIVSAGAGSTIAPTDAQYIFAIPTSEVQNNSSL